MARAKYYVRLDTYWTFSQDVWYGPYSSKDEAEQAVNASCAVRDDLGNHAANVRDDVRCYGIYTTTYARKEGMRVALTSKLPRNIEDWRGDLRLSDELR